MAFRRSKSVNGVSVANKKTVVAVFLDAHRVGFLFVVGVVISGDEVVDEVAVAFHRVCPNRALTLLKGVAGCCCYCWVAFLPIELGVLGVCGCHEREKFFLKRPFLYVMVENRGYGFYKG